MESPLRDYVLGCQSQIGNDARTEINIYIPSQVIVIRPGAQEKCSHDALDVIQEDLLEVVKNRFNVDLEDVNLEVTPDMYRVKTIRATVSYVDMGEEKKDPTKFKERMQNYVC
ncbi:unnamed protein product [Echinostoma caproni]|uniref:DUF59 domain-containing protein n=1 Tax=Echinostoma caproni TaxID=27848 RepID=A0A183ALZ8_9TREM|nr:unnamed protein product [Echinostoma caproni]